jgi:hypothetical protein
LGSPGLVCLFPLPFRLFFLAFVYINQYLVALLHLLLGGDPCRSVGDQPPLLTPRGDPARLGDLSADPPLVVLLYSSCDPPPLRIILFSFSGTQGGAGSPPPKGVGPGPTLAWPGWKQPDIPVEVDTGRLETSRSEAGVLKKLSLAGIAKLSRLKYR